MFTSQLAAQEVISAHDFTLPIRAVVVEDTAAVSARKLNWKNDIDLEEINAGWRMLQHVLEASTIAPPETLYVTDSVNSQLGFGEYRDGRVLISPTIFTQPHGYFTYGALHELEHHVFVQKRYFKTPREEHCHMLHGGSETTILSWIDSIYHGHSEGLFASIALSRLEKACGITRLQVVQLKSVSDSLLKTSGWPEVSRISISFIFVDQTEPSEEIMVTRSDNLYTFHMILSQSLVRVMGSKDEMAAVMGHALGHAKEYMVFNANRKVAFYPSRTFSMPRQAFLHESDMDMVGLGLMRRAGFNPNGMVSLYTKVFRFLADTRDELNVDYLECRLLKIETEAGVRKHGSCAPSLQLPTW